MKDYAGREIKAGDVLAYATVRGSSAASLTKRYVLSVVPNFYVEVQSEPGPPVEDKRCRGRLTTTEYTCLILD